MSAQKPKHPELGSAILFVRSIRRWSQRRLAKASGISPQALSNIERGVSEPSTASLDALAAALRVPVPTLYDLAARVGSTQREDWDAAADGSECATDSATAPFAIRQAAIRLVTDVCHTRASDIPANEFPDLELERREALGLWTHLAPLSGQDRLATLEASPALWRTGLCDFLCDESLNVSGNSGEEAAALAQLAVEVSRRVVASEPWRSQLQAYALAHLANSARILGDLTTAESLLSRATAQWQAVESSSPLNLSRFLALQASLRTAQRRLDDALGLLDRALAADRWGETPRLWIAKAKTLEELGRFDAAIVFLHRAACQLDAEKDGRLVFLVHLNLALLLLASGMLAEAEQLQPTVQDMARELGNELDSLRVLWLRGRIAATAGRTDEAIRWLDGVRRRFLGLRSSYDAALVTLEVAALHAERGETLEVRRLAIDSATIFRDRGIHREARRALSLFRLAAQREDATLQFVRNVLGYLEHARCNFTLRYEPNPRKSPIEDF